MNNKEIANEILKKVGGKDNVTANVACMTRLRLGIKDESKVDLEGLKRIDGVLAVVNHYNVAFNTLLTSLFHYCPVLLQLG